jgi:hypothetical protein
VFWNSVLAYLFIYIDTVVSQPEAGSGNTSSGARLILLIIAIYGTTQMFIKLMLAYIHQIGWMLTNCCQGQMEKGRVDLMRKVWKDLDYEYEEVMNSVLKGDKHSNIIRKKRPIA